MNLISPRINLLIFPFNFAVESCSPIPLLNNFFSMHLVNFNIQHACIVQEKRAGKAVATISHIGEAVGVKSENPTLGGMGVV